MESPGSRRLPLQINDNPEDDTPLLTGKPRRPFRLWLGILFFILIGIAPQLVQNAIFAETAVFRLYLAEGDNIYFYILAAFVLAHVISFIFVLCPGLTVASTFFGHLIFMGNLILAIVLSFLWDSQSPNKFAGLTSTSLFLCALFAGICGNTSANVLYPFASKFHPILLTALSAGYGLSGVIVSTLVIAQQSDTTDLVFSVKTYFIVVISLASVCYFIYILMAHSNLADTLLAARTVRSQISVEEPSRTKICTSITSACFNMFICSMITFWLPSLFISLVPLSLNSDPRFFSYLNFLFLLLLPLGAFLATVIKFYYISIVTLLQTALFLYVLLPTLFPFTLSASWLTMLVISFVFLLGGYNMTMIYLGIRKDFASNSAQTDRLSRIVTVISQCGSIIGVTITCCLAYYKMYNKSIPL